MIRAALVVFVSVASVASAWAAESQWPAPKSPAIPEADGYVVIPGAAVTPDASHVYRAIFDANRAADKPDQLVPAINMLGSELNALAAANVPQKNAKFVLVFHGPAMDGVLDEAHYKAKFGVSNPNLKVIAELRKAGVELYVCGQNLAYDKIDPKSLTPDVAVASDALIVLMTYENKGYALLSF